MKYFLDTEFIEGFHKPLFGKRRHHIDLISIGMVDEDNNWRYYLSNEFNYKDANPWVRNNVLLPLYKAELKIDSRFGVHNFHKKLGCTNEHIMQRIISFIYNAWHLNRDEEIEVYAYFGDYDWVAFCSLFGTMMDLPGYLPKYCRDLKQMLDEKVERMKLSVGELRGNKLLEKDRDATFQEKLTWVKSLPAYPKQDVEHHALADAQWNKRLYEFIKAL